MWNKTDYVWEAINWLKPGETALSQPKVAFDDCERYFGIGFIEYFLCIW